MHNGFLPNGEPQPFYYISLRTTPLCPAGLRAWRSSFGSAGCGLRVSQISLPNVWGFVASLVVWTVAANTYFFYSLILSLKSPSFKSWLNLKGIYVIFTPNITASSTSLNNTGGQQSSVSIWQGGQQQSMRWRRRSSNALMMFPFFTFSSESFHLPSILFVYS